MTLVRWVNNSIASMVAQAVSLQAEFIPPRAFRKLE